VYFIIFDIISPNVTECAKKSILASKFNGSYFLDMPTPLLRGGGVEKVSIGAHPIGKNIH